MNNQAPDGGGGKYSTYDLDIHQINEASLSDFEKVSEMETRRDGWKAYRDLMADMRDDLDAEFPNLKENFDSPAGRVFVEALTKMSNSIANHREVADSNRESTDAVIDEVKRVRPLIEDIMEDRKLAVDNKNEMQGMPQDGSDAYSQALEDTLAEARSTFSESNGVYGDSHAMMAEPPAYNGPVYAGPGPETPLDGNYQHAYYPDDTPYRGETYSGGGGSGGSNSGSTPVTTTPGDNNGPELQNPGGSPPPTSTNPPVTTTPGPNPGQGSVPPATFVPGGTQSGGGLLGGSKPPLSPVGGKPTAGPLSGAKPTPGMARPTTGGPGMGPKSTTAPMSGRTAATGAPKNSLLPNQRQMAAGRTPVSGSGRVPSETASGAGTTRGVTSAGSARAGSVPSGAGRGGIVRGKPNAGFEESLYRNTRAGRTVPGVIGGAREPVAGGRTGAQPPRMAQAGKVIGERKNKGQPKRGGAARLQSGSLTNTTAKSKKDTRHTWQRMPVEQSTQPPTGAVAISRNATKRPQTPDEIAEAKLQARKKWRRKFYASKQEPRLEPASELFGGTEGKVTRGVIRGAGASQPVDRRDAGTRFSTYGWEDDA